MNIHVFLIILFVDSWARGENLTVKKDVPKAYSAVVSTEQSKRLLVFLSLFSGHFTNLKEVNQEKSTWGEVQHDVINVTFRSVFVPALPNDIVLFLDEAVNGVLFRLQILIVREEEMGIIRLEPHNFTDITKYKIGQFDVNKDFDNVRLEDLSPTRPECENYFMQTDVNVFVGTFPDCNRIVDEARTVNAAYFANRPELSVVGKVFFLEDKMKPAKYAFTLSCKTMAVLTYWRRTKEKDSLLPYQNCNVFRYPLVPSVAPGAENFSPPCDCEQI